MNPTPECGGQATTHTTFIYWLGAGLVLVIALVLALGVIPLVMGDHLFHATPHQAAAVLWVSMGVNVALGARLVTAALRPEPPGPVVARRLGWWSGLCLILALFFLDPAFGCFEHDNPGMRRAAYLLFACAALEVLGSALAFATSVRARRAQAKPSSTLR